MACGDTMMACYRLNNQVFFFLFLFFKFLFYFLFLFLSCIFFFVLFYGLHTYQTLFFFHLQGSIKVPNRVVCFTLTILFLNPCHQASTKGAIRLKKSPKFLWLRPISPGRRRRLRPAFRQFLKHTFGFTCTSESVFCLFTADTDKHLL